MMTTPQLVKRNMCDLVSKFLWNACIPDEFQFVDDCSVGKPPSHDKDTRDMSTFLEVFLEVFGERASVRGNQDVTLTLNEIGLHDEAREFLRQYDQEAEDE